MNADQRQHLNENTIVADFPHGTVVLAQPGFTLDRDAKFLRENFGIKDTSVIKTLGESKGRILSDEEKDAELADAAKVPARRRAATPEA